MFVINLKLHVVPLVTVWNKDSKYLYFQQGYFHTSKRLYVQVKCSLHKYNLSCYISQYCVTIPREKYTQILRTSSFIDFDILLNTSKASWVSYTT